MAIAEAGTVTSCVGVTYSELVSGILEKVGDGADSTCL